MKSHSLSRRTLLRGLFGGSVVTLGLPLLGPMLNDNGTALADGAPLAKRFGVFFWGNGRGVKADRWTPTGTGTGWQPSVELSPLADVKDYVSVVTGLSARLPRSQRAHHNGAAAVLSGYDYLEQDAGNAAYRSTFGRPSIDQLAAATLGQDTPYRSLELGISERTAKGEGTTVRYLSHSGPDRPNPPEVNPQALFDRLFARSSEAQDSERAAQMRALRASVLDGVLEELNDLEKRIGRADRVRLEQHTEHVRAIERRLQASAERSARCAPTTRPDAWPIEEAREPLGERMQAMGELLALALSCDLTRVFSIQFSGSVGSTMFWQVNLERGHHQLSHEGEATQPQLEASTIFTMEQLASLLQTLRDTPDGDENLLDRTVILATSDSSNGSTHSVEDMPMVIAGRAGGALTHPGVHHAAESGHTNQVLLSILRAVGVDIDAMGEGDARQSSGIAAIEA